MKIGILLADGFEEIEALGVCDVLRRANINTYLVSTTNKNIVTSSHNIGVICDMLLSKELEDFDMLILPGGLPGATNLRDNKEVISLIKYFLITPSDAPLNKTPCGSTTAIVPLSAN